MCIRGGRTTNRLRFRFPDSCQQDSVIEQCGQTPCQTWVWRRVEGILTVVANWFLCPRWTTIDGACRDVFSDAILVNRFGVIYFRVVA